MKTLTQDRDNIQLLYEQATDEIQRLRRQVSRARSPSPSRAASAVLVRVESERDAALADVRRTNIQLDNLEDKLKVCCRENPIPFVRLSRRIPPYDPINVFQLPLYVFLLVAGYSVRRIAPVSSKFVSSLFLSFSPSSLCLVALKLNVPVN